MTRQTIQQACLAAIAEEMRADPNVFVMGEDIGIMGGPQRSHEGLWAEFGPEGRVIDTPISEGTFIGAAIGAAMQGKRPVVHLMYLQYLGLVMQQVLEAGAMHYLSGGALQVPMVIRAIYGGGGPSRGHAADLHSWVASVPGFKIVAPSNPVDAKGLMRSAIRDNNPVLYLEHSALFHASRSEVSDDPSFVVPIGKATVTRAGTDLTLVASAFMVKRALEAADTLAQQGISAEVVDLRTIVPLDKRTVLDSLRKTGRLIVVSESVKTGGSANDVVAIAAEEAFDVLKAPIVCVAPPPVPAPFSRVLETAFLPSVDDILLESRKLIAFDRGVLGTCI